MYRNPYATAALAFALLASCAGVNANQDYDPSADFAGLRSFDWYPGGQPKTGNLRLDNPLLDQRIRGAVERILAESGYERVSNRRPDFYVAYHLSFEQRLDVETLNGRYGYARYPRWSGVGFETHVSDYQQGTLVIDVADARVEKLVWRGWGSRRVRENPTPEQTTDTVERAVSEILGQFPPR